MEISNDAMAFSCRGPQHNFIINVSWLAEDRDKVNVADVRKRVKEIISAAEAGNNKAETTYGNYGMLPYLVIRFKLMKDADEITGDDKVMKLFGGNYRKLQSIKAEYEQVLSLYFLLLCQI